MAGMILDFIEEIFASLSGIDDGEGFGSTLRSVMLVEDWLLIEFFPSLENGELYLTVCHGALALTLLKCIQKGFKIYILWRDGDAEISPANMCVGMIYGMSVCFCFGEVYLRFADAAAWFCNEIMTTLHIEVNFIKQLAKVIVPMNLILSLMMFITLILGIILLVKITILGLQIFILRMGIPFACIGLVDSDSGVFNSYLMTLVKSVFTVMLQLILFAASCTLLGDGSFKALILCMVFLGLALKTPSLLNQFLIPNVGGGIGQKISVAAQISGLMRRF